MEFQVAAACAIKIRTSNYYTAYAYKRDSTRWIVNDKSKKGIFGDGTSGSYGNEHIFFQDFIVSSYNSLDSFYPKNIKIVLMIE